MFVASYFSCQKKISIFLALSTLKYLFLRPKTTGRVTEKLSDPEDNILNTRNII